MLVNVGALEGRCTRCPGTGLAVAVSQLPREQTNQVPLQEQRVFLATEPALQLPN